MINIVETAMALIESIKSNENEEKHDMTINELHGRDQPVSCI